MAAAAGLVAFGAARGHWVAPAVILAGLFLMRVIVWALPPDAQEIAAGALWIFSGGVLLYLKWYLAGFLLCLSGLTYPVLLAVGHRIVLMGLSPIIADAFLILSLMFVGGGLVGLGASGSAGDTSGPDVSRMGVAQARSENQG